MDTQQLRIVVGVSGPEESAAAVRFAVEEARRRQLPVRLVHVLQPLLAGTPGGVDLIGVTREPVLQWAHRMLTEVAVEARRLAPGVPIDIVLVAGHPISALVDEGADAAMLVLQPRDLAVQHLVPSSSVTGSVAARSRRPVVAVPGCWSGSPDGVVAVGVGTVGGGTVLLRTAFEEAQARGTRLRVVHAWHQGGYDAVTFAGSGAMVHSAEVAAAIDRDLADLAHEFPRVPLDLVVRHGRPADVLVQESTRSALVVVGRHRTLRRETPHHLGSVARGVLHRACCPVTVVDPVNPPWVAEDTHHEAHALRVS